MFVFRNRLWCIGCFFNTLSFFGTALALTAIWFLAPSMLNRWYLILYGFSGVALSFVASVAHVTDGFRGKMTAKLLLGSGFAALCFAVLLHGESIFAQLEFKILLILALYYPVILILNAKRFLETSRECESCEFKMRWSKCPGFRELVCRFVQEGFVRPASRHPPTKIVVNDMSGNDVTEDAVA